jgi:hypothetical protein
MITTPNCASCNKSSMDPELWPASLVMDTKIARVLHMCIYELQTIMQKTHLCIMKIKSSHTFCRLNTYILNSLCEHSVDVVWSYRKWVLLHLHPLGRIQRKKLGLLWKSNERKQLKTYLRTSLRGSWSWWTRQGIHINMSIY